MYLAVCYPPIERASLESQNLARLFRLLVAIVLHVSIWPNPPNKIHFTREYSRLDIRDFAGTIYLDGSAASAPFPSLPLHSRAEPRLLGAKCVGFGDGS